MIKRSFRTTNVVVYMGCQYDDLPGYRVNVRVGDKYVWRTYRVLELYFKKTDVRRLWDAVARAALVEADAAIERRDEGLSRAAPEIDRVALETATIEAEHRLDRRVRV